MTTERLLRWAQWADQTTRWPITLSWGALSGALIALGNLLHWPRVHAAGWALLVAAMVFYLGLAIVLAGASLLHQPDE